MKFGMFGSHFHYTGRISSVNGNGIVHLSRVGFQLRIHVHHVHRWSDDEEVVRNHPRGVHVGEFLPFLPFRLPHSWPARSLLWMVNVSDACIGRRWSMTSSVGCATALYGQPYWKSIMWLFSSAIRYGGGAQRTPATWSHGTNRCTCVRRVQIVYTKIVALFQRMKFQGICAINRHRCLRLLASSKFDNGQTPFELRARGGWSSMTSVLLVKLPSNSLNI